MCYYGQLVTNLMQLDLSVSLFSICSAQFSPFSHVYLFATPWTAACQASLSITNSQSLLKAHVHRVGDAIQPSHHVFFSSCLLSFIISGSSPMSPFFPSGAQIIGASASASVFPVNIQDWFFFRMDWFDLLAIQGTLKSLLQHQSSKGICVCHLSVMSYSPCLDLTTRTEFKQHAKMRIKSQGPIYTHRVTGEAPIVFKGQSWIDLMQE